MAKVTPLATKAIRLELFTKRNAVTGTVLETRRLWVRLTRGNTLDYLDGLRRLQYNNNYCGYAHSRLSHEFP